MIGLMEGRCGYSFILAHTNLDRASDVFAKHRTIFQLFIWKTSSLNKRGGSKSRNA